MIAIVDTLNKPDRIKRKRNTIRNESRPRKISSAVIDLSLLYSKWVMLMEMREKNAIRENKYVSLTQMVSRFNPTLFNRKYGAYPGAQSSRMNVKEARL